MKRPTDKSRIAIDSKKRRFLLAGCLCAVMSSPLNAELQSNPFAAESPKPNSASAQSSATKSSPGQSQTKSPTATSHAMPVTVINKFTVKPRPIRLPRSTPAAKPTPRTTTPLRPKRIAATKPVKANSRPKPAIKQSSSQPAIHGPATPALAMPTTPPANPTPQTLDSIAAEKLASKFNSAVSASSSPAINPPVPESVTTQRQPATAPDERPQHNVSQPMLPSAANVAKARPIRPVMEAKSLPKNPLDSWQPTGMSPPLIQRQSRSSVAKPVTSRRLSRTVVRATLPPVAPTKYLASTTSASSQQDALRYLQQSGQEYKVRAWASAEASAWNSLQATAEGIDIAQRAASMGTDRGASSASDDLQLARTAIREARDFLGKYGILDVAAMERLVRSHTTKLLKHHSLENIAAAEATDRYFNEARGRLARLARYRPEAAQALDMLAAIYLGRDDANMLPSQTALCVRRAALQGQPNNASLASRLGMHLAALGLDDEAQWALTHSMSIAPTAETVETLDLVTRRAGDREAAIRVTAQLRSRMPAGQDVSHGPVPQVAQLSPTDFAKISRSVIPASATDNIAIANTDSTRSPPVAQAFPSAAEGQADSTAETKSGVRRMVETVQFWK